MNWYSSNQNSSLFDNSFSEEDNNINLRQEMHWILYGKTSQPIRVPKGHWVVYRRFDRCSPSEQYSNRTHEGIGGPAFKYTDSLLRTRRVPLDSKGIPLLDTKLGVDVGNRYAYYFEYTINPKIGDYIFEIEWDDHAITPVINNTLVYSERYKIKRVHGYRLENGNIQYFIVSSEFEEVEY